MGHHRQHRLVSTFVKNAITPAPSSLSGRAELRSQTRGRHAPRETSVMELGSVQNYCLIALAILHAQPWGVLSKKKKPKKTHKKEGIFKSSS